MGCCNAIDSYFADKHATRDLESYRRKGPAPTTKLLIEAVLNAGITNARLLDIGAGIGVLQHELLQHGVQSVEHVDASKSYLRVAQSECEQRGNTHRVTFISGDFTDPNLDVGEAEVVLLDRVLCCYPNYLDLVKRSTERCLQLYAISYPRNHVLARIAFFFDNLERRLQGKSFRAFVHRIEDVEALVASSGLTLNSVHNTLLWRVAVFRR